MMKMEEGMLRSGIATSNGGVGIVNVGSNNTGSSSNGTLTSTSTPTTAGGGEVGLSPSTLSNGVHHSHNNNSSSSSQNISTATIISNNNNNTSNNTTKRNTAKTTTTILKPTSSSSASSSSSLPTVTKPITFKPVTSIANVTNFMKQPNNYSSSRSFYVNGNRSNGRISSRQRRNGTSTTTTSSATNNKAANTTTSSTTVTKGIGSSAVYSSSSYPSSSSSPSSLNFTNTITTISNSSSLSSTPTATKATLAPTKAIPLTPAKTTPATTSNTITTTQPPVLSLPLPSSLSSSPPSSYSSPASSLSPAIATTPSSTATTNNISTTATPTLTIPTSVTTITDTVATTTRQRAPSSTSIAIGKGLELTDMMTSDDEQVLNGYEQLLLQQQHKAEINDVDGKGGVVSTLHGPGTIEESSMSLVAPSSSIMVESNNPPPSLYVSMEEVQGKLQTPTTTTTTTTTMLTRKEEVREKEEGDDREEGEARMVAVPAISNDCSGSKTSSPPDGSMELEIDMEPESSSSSSSSPLPVEEKGEESKEEEKEEVIRLSKPSLSATNSNKSSTKKRLSSSSSKSANLPFSTASASDPSMQTVCIVCKKEVLQLPTRTVLNNENCQMKCPNCDTRKATARNWMDIILTALYNLEKVHKRTYFHCRKEICAYIEHHWDSICPDRARTATWANTVMSQISTHPELFISGQRGSGYWALKRTGMMSAEEGGQVAFDAPLSRQLASASLRSSGSRVNRVSAGLKKSKRQLKKSERKVYMVDVTGSSSNSGMVSAEDEEEEDEEEHGEGYIVEDVVGKRILGRDVQYLIRWEGCSDNENSWESIRDLNCPELIQKFERLAQIKQLWKKSHNEPNEEGAETPNTEEQQEKEGKNAEDESTRTERHLRTLPLGQRCHQCKHLRPVIVCCDGVLKGSCDGRYCEFCLRKHYSEDVVSIHKRVRRNIEWLCPRCRSICSCDSCNSTSSHDTKQLVNEEREEKEDVWMPPRKKRKKEGEAAVRHPLRVIARYRKAGTGEWRYLVAFEGCSDAKNRWVRGDELDTALLRQYKHSLKLRLHQKRARERDAQTTLSRSFTSTSTPLASTSTGGSSSSKYKSKNRHTTSQKSQLPKGSRHEEFKGRKRGLRTSDFDIHRVVFEDHVQRIVVPEYEEVLVPMWRSIGEQSPPHMDAAASSDPPQLLPITSPSSSSSYSSSASSPSTLSTASSTNFASPFASEQSPFIPSSTSASSLLSSIERTDHDTTNNFLLPDDSINIDLNSLTTTASTSTALPPFSMEEDASSPFPPFFLDPFSSGNTTEELIRISCAGEGEEIKRELIPPSLSSASLRDDDDSSSEDTSDEAFAARHARYETVLKPLDDPSASSPSSSFGANNNSNGNQRLSSSSSTSSSFSSKNNGSKKKSSSSIKNKKGRSVSPSKKRQRLSSSSPVPSSSSSTTRKNGSVVV